MTYIMDVFRSQSSSSLRLRTLEQPRQSATASTSVVQQYNTAGVTLLWPKEESSILTLPEHQTNGSRRAWLRPENSATVAQEFTEAKVITLWSEHWIPSEPHQELIPWVGWFRPVSSRNWLWECTWPEEAWLHP
jgi:hypothetical protein